MTSHNPNHPNIETVVNNRTITAYLGLDLKTLCRSPLPGRTDNNPSFSIFIGKNGRQVWKDQALTGPGSCGNVITLHRILRGCNADTACRELLEWDGFSVMCPVSTTSVKTGKSSSTPRKSTSNSDKIGIRSSKPVEMARYIRETTLPVPAWVADQLELYVDVQNNLCFPTNNGIHYKGGKLATTSKTFAGNIGEAGFSICGNTTSTSWMVFEGLGDFLAFVDLVPGLHTVCGFLILNSTNTIPQAIEWLKTQDVTELGLLLDKDAAGDKQTARFILEIPIAVDQRAIITHGKDFKDTWQHGRQ